VDAVREAIERHDWGTAYRLLTERAAAGPLSIDELEALGEVAYLTGREDEAFERWTAGHAACLDTGDVRRAARFGIHLGLALGSKGDIARASGWVKRVRQLLEETPDCVEHGYVDHGAGMCRIFEDGDIPGAHELFVQAGRIADRHGDRELRALANLGLGRCTIYLGELAEGVALLDEVMVAVEAGEMSPILAGDAYCTVIDGCYELLDIRRCEVWSESFTRWCDDQPELVLYRGQCLLHRAELLLLHGRWAEGAAFAREACDRLADPVNFMAIGGAHYVEAELRRLRGEFEAAERAYGRAHETGCDPHPGLSLLRLAQGQVDAAGAGARRALAEAEDPVRRAKVLGPYAEIMLAAGDVEAADAAVHELAAIALEFGSPLLRAQAAHLTGAARLAQDDATGALVSLRAALSGFTELDAPYDAARTRLVIADACDAVGDADGAAMERRAARATLERLATESGAPASRPAGLSEREVEVLALVAAGHSNKAVAEELYISEKTVTSHLTHIFTKLGVSSRAAATAFAYEHGLARPRP
jgi:DNA-binding CsgD family transcriptional regulator/tetratricopeptide (TPR) repeat protein